MGTLRFFEEVVSFKIRRTFGFADYTGYEIRKICSGIRFDISFGTGGTNSHAPAFPETRSGTEANPVYGTDSRQHTVTYCFTTIKKIHSTPFPTSLETIIGAEIIY